MSRFGIGQFERDVSEGRLDALADEALSELSKRPRAYIPSTALAKSVEFDEAMMRVAFADGRVLCVPLAWFPTLLAATPEQRARCEIGGGGVGMH